MTYFLNQTLSHQKKRKTGVLSITAISMAEVSKWKKKNKEKPGPETSAPLYRVQGLRRVHERVWRDWGSGRESSVTSWTNGSFLKLGVLPQNDNMCMFRFHVPERYMVPMDDSCYKSSQRKSNLSGEADLKGVSLNLAMLLETSKTLMKLRSFSLPIF